MKPKSAGKVIFYGLRDIGSRRPLQYWAPSLGEVRAYKKREETIGDDWEIVRIIVKPVRVVTQKRKVTV